MFYAEIEVTEYGEQPRYQTIGPFDADTEQELEDNLRRRGDDVVCIWEAASYDVTITTEED